MDEYIFCIYLFIYERQSLSTWCQNILDSPGRPFKWVLPLPLPLHRDPLRKLTSFHNEYPNTDYEFLMNAFHSYPSHSFSNQWLTTPELLWIPHWSEGCIKMPDATTQYNRYAPQCLSPESVSTKQPGWLDSNLQGSVSFCLSSTYITTYTAPSSSFVKVQIGARIILDINLRPPRAHESIPMCAPKCSYLCKHAHPALILPHTPPHLVVLLR